MRYYKSSRLADVHENRQEPAGKIVRFENDEKAKYVKNVSGSEILAKLPVLADFPAVPLFTSPYRIYGATDDTSSGSMFTCVGFTTVAVPADYWFWALMRGFIEDVEAADDAMAKGAPLTIANSGGTGVVDGIDTTLNQIIVGAAYNAPTTGTPDLVDVWLSMDREW